ncbi:MAG: ABC transporter ATP-binding protein [Candidatus Dojkabacteria bacterium]
MKNILGVLKLAKPLYGIMVALSLLILIQATIEQVAPILSKFIVDEISLQIQDESGDIERIFWLIAAAFGANMLVAVLSSLSSRLGDHFAGELNRFLTEKFYIKVLNLPQSYFDSEVSGKIVNQLSRGINSLKNFANTSTNFVLPSLMQSIFTIAVLAYYSPPVALFIFLLFPIYFVLTQMSAKKWGKKEEKKNAIEDTTRGRIQEVISNIKVVKSFLNEAREWSFISGNMISSNKIYAKQSFQFHSFDFLRNTSLQIILLLVNIVVFYNTFQGNLTLGEMVLIIQLVAQARRPLFAMSFILTNLQTAEAGAKEYLQIMNIKTKEDFSVLEDIEKIDSADVAFKDVHFSYEASNDVLKGINLKLKHGKKYALVGKSGAGKTTLINMILKFYDPTSGQISLNGKDFGNLSQKYVRGNISLVFQDNELFSSTIRENVAYGMPDASDEQIWLALEQANAKEFVEKLPKKLDAEIGERGVKLSGGQKQRLQIARAIIHDAPILILDEATSSLDAKSELEVQEALEKLMEGKLVIIIAHRFSTIQNVDEIIVLDEGVIADKGEPEALAKKQGLYSTLLKYQVEGNKKLLKNYELY